VRATPRVYPQIRDLQDLFSQYGIPGQIAGRDKIELVKREEQRLKAIKNR
jgi:hypothetical protein